MPCQLKLGKGYCSHCEKVSIACHLICDANTMAIFISFYFLKILFFCKRVYIYIRVYRLFSVKLYNTAGHFYSLLTRKNTQPYYTTSRLIIYINIMFHIFIFISIFIIIGYMTNSKLTIYPCGLEAQWIEHCTGFARSWVRIPFKPEFFQVAFSTA